MAKKKKVYRAVLGKDCTCAELAPPDASVAVMAQIEQVLEGVRELCPNNSFIALLRPKGGWIFVPILGRNQNYSVGTIWAEEDALYFDVLAKKNDDANKRQFSEDQAPIFFVGLRSRFERIKADAAKRLSLTT